MRIDLEAMAATRWEKWRVRVFVWLLVKFQVWNVETIAAFRDPKPDPKQPFMMRILFNVVTKAFLELLSVIMLILALLVACGSLVADVFVSNNTYWFQRSGAVLVAASLQAEFSSVKNADNIVGGRERKWVNPVRIALRTLAFFIAAIGTLIWAYGDLPFRV